MVAPSKGRACSTHTLLGMTPVLPSESMGGLMSTRLKMAETAALALAMSGANELLWPSATAL